MIGLAEVQSGLYHLQQSSAQTNKEMFSSSIGLPSSSLVKSCTVNYDLWHFHLGHIPNAKIQLINSSDSSVKATHNKVCEICPLAKQKSYHFLYQTVNQIKPFNWFTFTFGGLFPFLHILVTNYF